MRILATDTGDWINEAVATLREGGVVAHATETCYGFACDLSSPDAVTRLFAIKKRSTSQPVSGLFTSVEHAKEFVEWNAGAQELEHELPGPLTMILALRSNAPYTLLPMPDGGKTLGVRVSPHNVALSLVQTFGKPISTTSANLHGQSNPYSAEDIVAQFAEESLQPDLILDSGELPKTPPSRVIDLTGNVQKTIR